MMVLRVGAGAWTPEEQIRLWKERLAPDRSCRTAYGEGWAALVCGPWASIIETEDGPIVFQGRIHYQADLREKLGPSCEGLSSDADLAAAAIRRWGSEAPGHLEGFWAFARWREADGILEFSPDHVETIILIHAPTPDGYVVGTHIPLILSCEGFRPRLDRQNLAMMITGYPERSRTAWENLRTADPGHSTVWMSNRGISSLAWWNPEGTSRDVPAHRSQRMESFRGIWESAIQESIPSRGNPALFLSAGLDSSLVAGWIAPVLDTQGRRVLALTESPDPYFELSEDRYRLFDEWPLARAFSSAHSNIDHHRVYSGGTFLPDVLGWIHDQFDTPVRNSGNFGWVKDGFQLAADRGSDTMLWGARGNATVSFSTDRSIAAGEALVRGDWGTWRSLNSHWPSPKKLAIQIIAGIFPTFWMKRMARKTTERILAGLERSILRSDWLPSIRAIQNAQVGNAIASRKAFVQMSARGFAAPIGDLHGIHDADPTADRRVCEASLRLPFSDHFFDGWNRSVARELGHGKLPESILHGRLRGVQSAEIGLQFVRHAARYGEVWARCLAEPVFHEIVDTKLANTWFDQITTEGTEQDPEQVHQILRAIDVGLFLIHSRLRYGSLLGQEDSSP